MSFTREVYKRKSDGKIAQTYCLFDSLTGEFIKKYYVIDGEPKNIQQEEVDDKNLWEIVIIDAITERKFNE